MKRGRLGLGPIGCRAGDLIRIFLESPVHSIADKYSYEFRGKAYVGGIMDYGDDMKEGIRKVQVDLQNFTLC